MNNIIKAENFAEGYRKLLNQVYFKPDFISMPRNMKIKECINFGLEIKNPLSNLFTNYERSINLKYLSGELIWYFSGSNDLEFIEKFSKFWKKIANTDNTCNSAYGYLLFNDYDKRCITSSKNLYYDEWSWAYESLSFDKDSRQAIIHFNKTYHMYEKNKDFPCTIYGNFHIRKNKLYFTINMRSSDSVRGTTFDIPFFMLLHQEMYLLLKKEYSDLQLGKFTYFSNSQHIYEEHFSLIERMLKYPFIEEKMPLIKNSLILNNKIIQLKNDILNNKYSDKYDEDEFINFLYLNSI